MDAKKFLKNLKGRLQQLKIPNKSMMLQRKGKHQIVTRVQIRCTLYSRGSQPLFSHLPLGKFKSNIYPQIFLYIFTSTNTYCNR